MEIYIITTSYYAQIYFIITSYMKYGWLWWRIVDTAFPISLLICLLQSNIVLCLGLEEPVKYTYFVKACIYMNICSTCRGRCCYRWWRSCRRGTGSGRGAWSCRRGRAGTPTRGWSRPWTASSGSFLLSLGSMAQHWRSGPGAETCSAFWTSRIKPNNVNNL